MTRRAKPSEKKAPVLADAGGHGFKRYSGIVSEEFHPHLQGKLGVRVYKEMNDNDPLIGGAHRGQRMLIRQAPWPVKPADTDNPADESQAAFWAEKLSECMYDMATPWRTVIDEMLSMSVYGWCLMWESWKLRRGDNESKKLHSRYDDGLWGWRDLEIRKQDTIERWLYSDDDEEELIGAEQIFPPSYRRATLPIERMTHLRYEPASGSPEGKSALRNSYRPYYMGGREEEIEGTGIERDLAGYPIMEVPVDLLDPNASTAQKSVYSQMKDFVQKVKRDQLEGAVIPSEDNPDGTKTGFKFRLMSSGGSRAIDVNQTIQRHQVNKLIALNWEFPLLGATESGSRALSSDKTQLAVVMLGGVMDIITETLNLAAVARWCRLNCIPSRLWPELTHGDVEKENIVEWVNGVSLAAQGGLIVPTDQDEKTVREKIGLEQRTADDEVLAPPVDESDPFGMMNDTVPDPPVEVEQAEPEPEPEKPSEAMTVDEAAEWLKVSRETLMRAIRNGKLPGAKFGNTYRILREHLLEFMTASPQQTSNPAAPPAARLSGTRSPDRG